MRRYTKKNNNFTKNVRLKKFVIAIIVGSVLIGFLIFIYFYNNNRNMNKPPSGTDQTINYSPATTEEKKEAENNKDKIVKLESQNQNSSSSRQEKIVVKPTITNTTNSVNAYVSGIFEEGGTCTAIFKKGVSELTKNSNGFQNVSYTQCTPINLEAGFLSTGNWTVVVKYTSDKSEGSSDPQLIEVK